MGWALYVGVSYRHRPEADQVAVGPWPQDRPVRFDVDQGSSITVLACGIGRVVAQVVVDQDGGELAVFGEDNVEVLGEAARGRSSVARTVRQAGRNGAAGCAGGRCRGTPAG